MLPYGGLFPKPDCGMDANEKCPGFVVGPVPTVMYIPDFISDAEQTELFNRIYQAPASKWKTLRNRRLQNWGGVVHEKGLISQDLPPWLIRVNQRIYEEFGTFPAVPNHVLVNEYLPDQGIMPHQDGPAYFPAAAILSLGSPVVMNFTPHPTLFDQNGLTEVKDDLQNHGNAAAAPGNSLCSFSLLLMPRSLLIFKDVAYSGTAEIWCCYGLLLSFVHWLMDIVYMVSDYLHGIEDNIMQSYDGAVNLTDDCKFEELVSTVGCSGEATELQDAKILHRTEKRISLTCRLVLKVHKNLIKIR